MTVIRRFDRIPTTEEIRAIEGVVVIDLAPPAPATGTGSGAVLLVGEFEDGFFATDRTGPSGVGGVEVFGSADFRAKFGSFGYTYAGVTANNVCARRHMQEDWNGNGYLKAFGLRAQKLVIARVDTSVGSVVLEPRPSIIGGDGPWALSVGDQLTLTTDLATGASTALAAVVATAAGAAATFGSIVAGDSITIAIDGGVATTVIFGSGDTTQAAVIARINNTMGYACAVANGAQVDLRGIVQGTSGSITLGGVTVSLTRIGHAAGTTAGTGNVGNIAAVTKTEIQTIVNGTAAIISAGASLSLDASGNLMAVRLASAATSTISIASTQLGTSLGFSPLATTVYVSSHAGGLLPAGTRVRNAGGTEWVTMQTLEIEAGETGPFTVKVRPALDDGTAVTATANTVTTLVDPVAFAALTVTNPSALSAAKTEVQMDNAYIAALNATLDLKSPATECNYLLCARRTDTVVREGKANCITASQGGGAPIARKFITGDQLGTSAASSIVNVAQYRSDRVFYTTKGLKVRVPEIAERGTAGGLGFTADGIITVRPDGPLTTLCASLPPEENPGQPTSLIDAFFEVDDFGETLSNETYIAWRAAGICAPRKDGAQMTFQSGVTSDLTSGRTTQARRKMADFIQDSSIQLMKPYGKKLNIQSRRDSCRAVLESFLSGLLSEDNPELARIVAYSIDDSANAGNTDASLALGVYRMVTKVRTASSLDDIVLQTEIGEGTVISSAS